MWTFSCFYVSVWPRGSGWGWGGGIICWLLPSTEIISHDFRIYNGILHWRDPPSKTVPTVDVYVIKVHGESDIVPASNGSEKLTGVTNAVMRNPQCYLSILMLSKHCLLSSLAFSLTFATTVNGLQYFFKEGFLDREGSGYYYSEWFTVFF